MRRLLDARQLRVWQTLPADSARRNWLTLLSKKAWVVYAKRPFGGPQQVLSYLSNYTHRVALSNRRITAVDEQARTLTFTYRDYRKGGPVKPLTLSAREFIRRFTLHLLPLGLVRIRHYGILGNNRRQRDIAKVRVILQRRPRLVPTPPPSIPNEPVRCPHCGLPALRLVGWIDSSGLRHLLTPFWDSS